MARIEDGTGGGRGSAEPEQQTWMRPQSVVFSLLAEHLLEHPRALFSGSFIEVLRRLGISEHATRSTVLRMARRGLLTPKRHGRKMYFAMTPRCVALLEDGRHRIWEMGAVNESTAPSWTLLTFSIPESWRRKRYDLRARLIWAGFGLLQNGAWLAPAEIDVSAIIAELDLAAHVRVFRIQPVAPTDASSVIREAFDLQSLAQRYRAFTAEWRDRPSGLDALTVTLRLSTQWLRIIREDPRVPLHLLPADWPAVEAQRLYRSLHGAHWPDALAIASDVLDTLPL
jgi:phenylacetic acid degradation operon negative regulatory protein